MAKKQHKNKNKMPIYIPNQNIDWLFGNNPELMNERDKESKYQKKLSLRNK